MGEGNNPGVGVQNWLAPIFRFTNDKLWFDRIDAVDVPLAYGIYGTASWFSLKFLFIAKRLDHEVFAYSGFSLI